MEEHFILLQPFKGKFGVPNFPLHIVPQNELLLLTKLRTLRRLEIREFKMKLLEAERRGLMFGVIAGKNAPHLSKMNGKWN